MGKRPVLDVKAVLSHWGKQFRRDSVENRLNVRVGSCYYDPENERIMQYMGVVDEENFPVDLGTSLLKFMNVLTGEVEEITEYEVSTPWERMNEMEVLAWAAR